MSKAITLEHLEWYDDLELQGKVVEATTNSRDKAFMSVLARVGLRPTQAIQIEEDDIDYKREALSIICLKESLRIDCPDCGERLAKKHHFCPMCGNKASQPIRDTIEERHCRTIPIHGESLTLIERYLTWRRQFSYRGPLVFPFSRQRAWQLVEKIGRRAGLQGLHPESLRHLLAARWINKGLNVDKLRFLLGYSLSTTGRPLHFSFGELQAEYRRLWK
jgi:site-specific recombinase XerD